MFNLLKKPWSISGVLFINRHELQELLLTDKRLGQVNIELARPGEKVRILHVTEAVEPRAKSEGSGVDFPGALGKQGNCRRRHYTRAPRCCSVDERIC